MAGPEHANTERIEHAGSVPLALLAISMMAAAGLWYATSRAGSDATPTADDTTQVTVESGPAPEPVQPAGAGQTSDGYRLLGSADRAGRTVTFARLPATRGGTSDSEIFTLLDGVLVVAKTDMDLTSLGQIGAYYAQPGERRDYILATEAGTALTNLGLGQFLPYGSDTEPVPLGEGFSILPGPDDFTVWLLTSAERSARLVELETGVERLTVDLTVEGRPLDAAGAGLIVSIADTRDADFAFWTPDRGRTPFIGTSGAGYVGAAASTAVFALGDEFLVMDLDNPSAPARRIPNAEPSIYRTTVSPDGTAVAASIVTGITEPNRIVVLDLADGSEIHRVTSSLEVLFQWSSPTRLLYLRPDWPAFDLVERNIVTGIDASVVRLEDLSWWYTAFEQPDDATLDS